MYTNRLIYEICFARLASLGSPSPRSSLHDDHPLIFEDRYTDNNLRDSWCALGRLPLARVSIPAGFDESNPCLMVLREILDILATVKLSSLTYRSARKHGSWHRCWLGREIEYKPSYGEHWDCFKFEGSPTTHLSFSLATSLTCTQTRSLRRIVPGGYVCTSPWIALATVNREAAVAPHTHVVATRSSESDLRTVSKVQILKRYWCL